MSDHGVGYHLGYETTKAYQAEMRSVAAQDRRARRLRSAANAGTFSCLVALLRDARMRLHVLWLGRDAANAKENLP